MAFDSCPNEAIHLLDVHVDAMNSMPPPRPSVHFFKEIPPTVRSFASPALYFLILVNPQCVNYSLKSGGLSWRGGNVIGYARNSFPIKSMSFKYQAAKLHGRKSLIPAT